jgi:hypothetical protein
MKFRRALRLIKKITLTRQSSAVRVVLRDVVKMAGKPKQIRVYELLSEGEISELDLACVSAAHELVPTSADRLDNRGLSGLL